MGNRKHIKTDIRPYVCLMDNCVNPYATFPETEDWLQHMNSEHRKQIVRWTCNAKQHGSAQVFDSQQKFEDHLRTQHASTVSEKQLPIITKRSGGPAAEIFTRCPLCSWDPTAQIQRKDAPDGSANGGLEISDAKVVEKAMKIRLRNQLQRHIADHLQLIALRSLPDELISSSDKLIKSSSSSSSSTTMSTESELNITKSEIDHLQNPDKLSDEQRALIQEPVRGMNAINHGEDWSLDPLGTTGVSRDQFWGWVYYGLAKTHHIKPCTCPFMH